MDFALAGFAGGLMQQPSMSQMDSDIMAGLMQMPGQSPLDTMGMPGSFGGDAGPAGGLGGLGGSMGGGMGGGLGGASTGPTQDGLARLRSFLDTAGMAVGLGNLNNNSLRPANSMGPLSSDGMAPPGMVPVHGGNSIDGAASSMLAAGSTNGMGNAGGSNSLPKMRPSPSLMNEQTNMGMGGGMGVSANPMPSPWVTAANDLGLGLNSGQGLQGINAKGPLLNTKQQGTLGGGMQSAGSSGMYKPHT